MRGGRPNPEIDGMRIHPLAGNKRLTPGEGDAERTMSSLLQLHGAGAEPRLGNDMLRAYVKAVIDSTSAETSSNIVDDVDNDLLTQVSSVGGGSIAGMITPLGCSSKKR